LSGLKQQNFILTEFKRPEVLDRVGSCEAMWEDPLRVSLQPLVPASTPWLVDTPLQSLPSTSRGLTVPVPLLFLGH
jgi:hypothetical protein